MRRILLLALLAMLGTPAWASADWTFASSGRFEIFTTAGSRRARDVLGDLERVYSFFADTQQLAPPAGRVIRLIVFSNEREFRPYRMNDAVVAFYRPGLDRDYIVMQSPGVEAHAVVVHEYVHLIVARSGARYPVWLNEGLADYFATLSISGRVATVGNPPDSRLEELASGRLLPLDQLFAVNRESPEYRTKEQARLFYAESWALTHMLLTHDRYRSGAYRFLTIVRAGRSAEAALSQVYGTSLRDTLSDLRAYISDGRFVARTMKVDAAIDESALPTRPATTLEAGLATADLLASVRDDQAKARAAFDALARQYPSEPAVYDARGAFELRWAGAEAARPFLSRAVELDTTSARTYRTYAGMLPRGDVATAERLLRTAVTLDPSDTRTRVRLGALLPERPAEVLAVLEPVAEPRPPDAFGVWQLRANAYLSLDELERAREAARELARVAWSRPQRTTAADLLASIEARLSERDRAGLDTADGQAVR